MEPDTKESHATLSNKLNFCLDRAILIINLHEGLPLILCA